MFHCGKIYPAVVLAMALLIIACSKPTPTKTTYYDDLIGFIQDSQDGRELFSNDIYPAGQFQLNDLMMAQFSFDSASRSYYPDINKDMIDIYGFRSINTAGVRINDNFYGDIHLITGSDTAVYPLTIRLVRHAFFLKLYDDAHVYHGWRFWVYGSDCALDESEIGIFTGVSQNEFGFSQAEAPIFRTPYSIEKKGMVRLPLHDSLTYVSQTPDRIFAENNEGVISAFNTFADGSDFKTGWRIPRSTAEFFHLIVIEAPWELVLDTIYADTTIIAIDTSIEKTGDLIIPYKADI
jgi:hypothetical protein